MEIIFATGNKGKLREVKAIYHEAGLNIKSLKELTGVPEIIEDGLTFEENARIKAVTIYDLFRIPVIADDSGLAVEQLQGRPGVYSARYAGENATDEDNNRKLLTELSLLPEPHPAKFVCCAVFYDGERCLKAFGEIPGRIIKSPKGKHGFGYDPLFMPQGFARTMAEMDIDEKNKISHRAKAFNLLKDIMRRDGKYET
ncbi:MAG: RdgB/HAM1 family non-canonical purine NTP pyrophosphatase [Ignavibacteria bacterium]|jgi:XTP/dITP diphosphohydrolase|nr:RdgB/HAM1 family non-canonical purine NTP pyrophosphatase [Ignavibacteria bacterium]MCU7515283.1 RdgB/HAM1 family non-canonical purine NTP pyrophosphatase [Ignavibacteria bacterium]